MKKFAVIGLAAVLVSLPAAPLVATCGGGVKGRTEAPALTAPVDEILEATPQISDPVPQIPDPIPPVWMEEGESVPPDFSPAAEEKERYVLTLVSGLNVRKGAGTAFPALGQADKGALLALSGAENGWYRTFYRGQTAYVSASETYTAVNALEWGDERTERVIAEGMRLLGVPYVYGATRFHDGNGQRLGGFTEEAFDCSSLMQYIFYRGAGVLLDVTTRTQVKQGVHVEREDLRRGDLLFFTNAARYDKTGIERVGHVALYLGENYILHTASDFAKAEQISAARRNYFLEARRVL